MNEAGSEGDHEGKDDTASSGIGRRLGNRDHEEREQEECAVLKMVKGNRERVTEKGCTRENDRAIEADQSVGDVASSCAMDDEATATGEKKREEGSGAPLARRHSDTRAQSHHHRQPEVGGVEYVSVVDAQKELARDRDHRRDCREHERIGTQQKTQRQR